MITGELLTYIEKNLRNGSSGEEIKDKLLKVGWKTDDLNEAFLMVANRIEKKGNTVPIKKNSEMKNEIKTKQPLQEIKKVEQVARRKPKPLEEDPSIKIYSDRHIRLKSFINHLVVTAILLLLVTLAIYGYFWYYHPDSQIIDLLLNREQ